MYHKVFTGIAHYDTWNTQVTLYTVVSRFYKPLVIATLVIHSLYKLAPSPNFSVPFAGNHGNHGKPLRSQGLRLCVSSPHIARATIGHPTVHRRCLSLFRRRTSKLPSVGTAQSREKTRTISTVADTSHQLRGAIVFQANRNHAACFGTLQWNHA